MGSNWRTRAWVLGLLVVAALAGQAFGQAGGNDGGDLALANRLLGDRLYDLAATEYEACLSHGAQGRARADALYGLAMSRLLLGQYAEARGQFETLVREAPEHPNIAIAWFRIGEAAYVLGDLEAARDRLQTYVERWPEHHHGGAAYSYLGDTLLKLGKLTEARAAYEEALERNSDGPRADRDRFGMARVCVELKDREQARALFGALIEQGGRDWQDKAALELARLELADGRDEQAATILAGFAADYPQSALLGEASLEQAGVLAGAGKSEEAEAVLRGLSADESGVALRATYKLAGLLIESGRGEEAETLCAEALERTPDPALAPLLTYRWAEAAQARGDLKQARVRLERVAETYRDDEWADDALLGAAQIAMQSGDPAGAIELAGRFQERYPTHERMSEARFIEAQAALATNQTDRAVRVLEELRSLESLEPKLAQAVGLTLGVAYRSQGELDRSAEVLGGLAARMTGANAADARYAMGLAHFDAGRDAEAVPALEAYLSEKPGGEVAADALAMLAVSQGRLGQTEDAAQTLDRLEAEHPGSSQVARTRLDLGEQWLRDGKPAEALAVLEVLTADAAADDPILPLGLWNQGWALLEMDRAREAAEVLGRIGETKPNDVLAFEARLAQSRAWERAGAMEQALEVLDGVQVPDDDLMRAARSDRARAQLLNRLGRADESATAYDRYIQQYGEIPALREELDQVLAAQGWALVEAGKLAQAEKVFERVLTDYPESDRTGDARAVLADAAYQRQDWNRVEELLTPLVDGPAGTTELGLKARFRLGQTRFDRGDWSGAIEQYDHLIAAAPAGPLASQARFWKAESAIQAGDPATAEPILAELLADAAGDTGDEPAWMGTARLRRIEALVSLERWNEALDAAEALRTTDPDFPAMHAVDCARGRALQAQARFDEARDAYQRVIDAGRDDDLAARSQFLRGETYFHQEQFAQALREYLRVQYNYPDQASWQAAALLQAGKVAERMDRWSDAVDFYNRLIQNHPDQPQAAEARERLAAAQAHLSARVSSGGR